ncbi:MAG: hypothetical protein Q9188_004789 [Gyalolechia gomerana]
MHPLGKGLGLVSVVGVLCYLVAAIAQDNATGAGSAIVGVHRHKHNHRHVKRRDLAALEPRGTRTGHGDGPWYADMDGDGLDDMVWVTEDGQVSVWSNGQANANLAAQFSWNWIPQNNGQPIVTGINAKREQYHFADINGDGKADLVIVEMDTGILSAWLNVGANLNVKPSGWVWTPVGTISPAVGDAAGVRFADVTGDGKADLIWLDEGSRMSIYRNDYNPGSQNWWWNKITNTAIDLGTPNRKDMRFADIDGDQKADALWVHPSDGTTVAWFNRDPSKLSGWVRFVPYPNTIDPPHMPTSGGNIMFARITVPYGRADFVMVDAPNGVTLAWKNLCNNYAPGSSSNADQADGDNMNVSGNSGSGQPVPASSTSVISNPTTVVPSAGGSTSKSDSPTGGNSASASSIVVSSRIVTVRPLPVDSTSEPIVETPTSGSERSHSEALSTTAGGGVIISSSSGKPSGVKVPTSAGSSLGGSSKSRFAQRPQLACLYPLRILLDLSKEHQQMDQKALARRRQPLQAAERALGSPQVHQVVREQDNASHRLMGWMSDSRRQSDLDQIKLPHLPVQPMFNDPQAHRVAPDKGNLQQLVYQSRDPRQVSQVVLGQSNLLHLVDRVPDHRQVYRSEHSTINVDCTAVDNQYRAIDDKYEPLAKFIK